MEKITYDEFKKIELRTAKVLSAEKVTGSEKLLRLTINVGDKNELGEPLPRQIVSGIAKYYSPEEMVGKQIIIVANLEPRMIMGLESNGMIVAAHGLPVQVGAEGSAVIVSPDKEVPPGSELS